jgi:hypothetical protein
MIDVTPIVPPADVAELFTRSAMEYLVRGGRKSIRPVYCPKCGTHFTTLVPAVFPRAPTVVHYVCGPCGGDGHPFSLEAPR